MPRGRRGQVTRMWGGLGREVTQPFSPSSQYRGGMLQRGTLPSAAWHWPSLCPACFLSPVTSLDPGPCPAHTGLISPCSSEELLGTPLHPRNVASVPSIRCQG